MKLTRLTAAATAGDLTIEMALTGDGAPAEILSVEVDGVTVGEFSGVAADYAERIGAIVRSVREDAAPYNERKGLCTDHGYYRPDSDHRCPACADPVEPS